MPRPNGTYREWTQREEKRLISEFMDDELTIDQIAEGLGRPRGTVHDRVRRLQQADRLPTKFSLRRKRKLAAMRPDRREEAEL